MTLRQGGTRARYYAERKKVEAQQGNPVRENLSEATRRRIAREIVARTWFRDADGLDAHFRDWMCAELNRVLLPSTSLSWRSLFDSHLAKLPLDDFLQALEICVTYIVRYRANPLTDINVLQSLLADDLSAYRLVDTGKGNKPRYQVQRIDNMHLHTEITDRTFELTQIAGLASAQRDYADAWRHYSRGDLDDAATNAGKAVESACKAVLKKIDPTSTPEEMNLGPLVTLLVQKDVIPSAMTSIATHLEHIFRASGGLRNQAGTGAHGSVDLTTSEASVALLALRLSGTLIAFLAERWTQIR